MKKIKDNVDFKELYKREKQEKEELKMQVKKDNHILGCNFASKNKYKQGYEDYKSRCEKINEILKESPDFNYSNDYIILKRRIESVLQNGSDNDEK